MTTLYPNKKKFQRLCRPLDAQRLLPLYRPQLQLVALAQRMLTPGVQDSVLEYHRGYGNDHLAIIASFRSTLAWADFHSDKLDFGQGIRVGCSKAQFCKAFHQSPKYNAFVFADSPARNRTLTFYFGNGRLQYVSYDDRKARETVRFMKSFGH